MKTILKHKGFEIRRDYNDPPAYFLFLEKEVIDAGPAQALSFWRDLINYNINKNRRIEKC